MIEILSPDQTSNRVTGNILQSLKLGSQIAWLIDPDDRSILIFQPNQQPELFQADDRLIILEDIPLELTANQIFNGLKMNL